MVWFSDQQTSWMVNVKGVVPRVGLCSIMGNYLELGLIILTMMEGELIKLSFIPTILTNIVCPGLVSSLTGIHFGDNYSQKVVTEENGVAMATTQVFKIFEISVSRINFFRFRIN